MSKYKHLLETMNSIAFYSLIIAIGYLGAVFVKLYYSSEMTIPWWHPPLVIVGGTVVHLIVQSSKDSK